MENQNENDIKNEDIIKGYFNIVMNFEAFGSSPDFTTPIQEFLFNNCCKIEEAKESGEQSINNYMLFKKYSELMDKTLEKFLEMGNLEPEVFIEALKFAREENLPCSFLDYVLSSIEYEDFYNLMMDYKKMNSKEIEEEATHVKYMDDKIKKDEEKIKKNKGKEIRHDKNKQK